MTRAVFPGSFNPPTLAHLAIARAAIEATGVNTLEFSLSRYTLGKEKVTKPTIDERALVLFDACAFDTRLAVRVTDDSLIADIAAGYDVLVLGADKWAQVCDSAWYAGSDQARDRAIASLPETVLVVPRGGLRPADDARVRILEVAEEFRDISSTAARTHGSFMVPEALASGLWT